jgi:hypothetical protein
MHILLVERRRHEKLGVPMAENCGGSRGSVSHKRLFGFKKNPKTF